MKYEDKNKEQRTKNKEQRTKNKEQRTKNKEQRTKNKEQRTKNKEQRTSVVIKFYRLERWLYEKGLRIPAKLIYHLIQLMFGCTIPPSAVLRKGVDIPHFHGIVLHQNTVVGEGTLIYQNVTIGGRNGKAGAVIGKKCSIGAGACILGAVTIGDNVMVGANAVVLKDVPSNCTVAGVPAKIVKTRE